MNTQRTIFLASIAIAIGFGMAFWQASTGMKAVVEDGAKIPAIVLVSRPVEFKQVDAVAPRDAGKPNQKPLAQSALLADSLNSVAVVEPKLEDIRLADRIQDAEQFMLAKIASRHWTFSDKIEFKEHFARVDANAREQLLSQLAMSINNGTLMLEDDVSAF